MLPGFGAEDDITGSFQYGADNINGTSQWGGYVEQPAARSQGGYIGGGGGAMGGYMSP
jgi:hypothetical protein